VRWIWSALPTASGLARGLDLVWAVPEGGCAARCAARGPSSPPAPRSRAPAPPGGGRPGRGRAPSPPLQRPRPPSRGIRR
jgi:hypothetical protein